MVYRFFEIHSALYLHAPIPNRTFELNFWPARCRK